MAKSDWIEKLDAVIARDARYPRPAYIAILMAFYRAGKRRKGLEPKRSKVTAQDLCRALRNFLINYHGDKALETMRSYGIRTSDDVGEIVVNLAQIGLIKFSEDDSREDFTDMFDFESELEKWRHARWGVAWGMGVTLLALPMLVCAGRELWRALAR